MTPLTLDVTLISADIIRHVTLFATRPRVFAMVTLLGGSSPHHVTTVDSRGGGFRPTWNFQMRFDVDEAKLRGNSLMLVIQLRHWRWGPFGDKNIGLLYVPVREIFDLAGGTNHRRRHVALPVSSKSGKAKGVIYLSYAFSGGGAILVPLSPLPSAPPLPLELGGFGHSCPTTPYLDTSTLVNSCPTTPYLDRRILVNSCPTTPYSGMYAPSAPCVEVVIRENSNCGKFSKVPYEI